MSKHKHADMIIAKANNMDLVVFYKKDDSEGWFVSSLDVMVYDGYDYEFFLCLPQHKDACLHWLNGGISQVEYPSGYSVGVIDSDMNNWISVEESLPKKKR